jgi:hypothetical protein
MEPKPDKWMRVFDKFIGQLTISSKETGVSKLKPYGSQRRFMKGIADALDNDVRDITVLKARQLGITTIMLGIDLFWLNFFKGTQGALVVDTEGNREQFRDTLQRYHESLPKSLRYAITKHNRDILTLSNGSVLHYLVAGTKSKGGGLGRGRGLNFVHATEMSSWGDPEGVASLRASLAEEHPNRLYVWESTARGYNAFYDMWEEAKTDPTQRALFIGWWTKESYSLPPVSKAYAAAWTGQLTQQEEELTKEVKDTFGVTINDRQWAWWRHKARQLMGDGQGFGEQEFPTTAESAFLMTGKPFFPRIELKKGLERAYKIGFKGYRYHMTEEFTSLKIEQVTRESEVELQVFEEPQLNGVYVIGADPAYGTSVSGNTWRDNFVVQVLRCYADRVVQVAEYSVDDISTEQFAWIIAHLCGWYRNTRLVLEITGPGVAVWQAMKHLRNEIQFGHRSPAARERGIDKIFDHMNNYLYMRQDSFGSGALLHLKMNAEVKQQIMARIKDAMLTGSIDLASVPLYQEMKTVINDGGWIGAEGRGKDDKVLALAQAYRGYDDWERAPLNAQNRTMAVEREREKRMAEGNKGTSFAQYVIQDFFRGAEVQRLEEAAKAAHDWRF